jgi:hypothetical protein
MRKKTFQLWREAAKLGAYAEMPMLPDDKAGAGASQQE